jgi:hypothetical protein
LDFRSTLAWNGRLTNFNGAEVFNFYSSGEEVLRDWDEDAPTNVISDAAQIIEDELYDLGPPSCFVWVWQEKSKGLAGSDGLLGSTHGGWKFNTNYVSLSISAANALPDSELMTNAFFDLTSPSFGTADLALYGDLGDDYAYENRYRIISDAIPALSFAVGAHSVPSFSPSGQPTRNFDMSSPDGVNFSAFQNGWPVTRSTGTEALKWHHSDFVYVAYPFTHQLFSQIITLGNLK